MWMTFCYRSKNMHTIERQLQQYLNKINRWTTENRSITENAL